MAGNESLDGRFAIASTSYRKEKKSGKEQDRKTMTARDVTWGAAHGGLRDGGLSKSEDI